MSIDLSSAFDVVNVKLLLKRIRIVGLPEDLIMLVDKWLNCTSMDRVLGCYYIEVFNITMCMRVVCKVVI